MNLAKRNTLVKVMLFSAAIIWGLSFIVIKDTIDIVPPLFLMALRFLLAALMLSAIFFKRLKKINWQYVLHGLISGLLMFGAYVLQTIGIIYTTPGKNAFLTVIYCVIVPFLFWAVNKKRPGLYDIIAAIICIIGIGLVSLDAKLSLNIGDLLTIGAGIVFAFYIVSIAVFTKDKDPIPFAFLQFAFCGIFSLISTFIFEAPSFAGWKVNTVLSMLYLAVGCSAICFVFQNIGQKYLNPSIVSLIMSLEAMFGVFFSVVFGYESLSIQMIIGFILISAAVVVSETKLTFLRRKKKIISNIENKIDDENNSDIKKE